MTEKRESNYEWRRDRGGINRAIERVEDLPLNLFARGRLVTDAAKRKLYQEGTVGRATILTAPSVKTVSEVKENVGRFTARVEIPGRELYEVKVWQSFQKWEWDLLQPGALVECRVDPGNDKRVLLCAPEGEEGSMRVEDSASLLASGKRAVATVESSEDMEMTAPGTQDPFYVLVLEVRSDEEPEPWRVRFAQRVPRGAESLVAPGSELQVAYRAVNDDAAVAVDWPATTTGRFS